MSLFRFQMRAAGVRVAYRALVMIRAFIVCRLSSLLVAHLAFIFEQFAVAVAVHHPREVL
jgi:hypothetical protein